jgi:monoamine oxidase
VFEAESRVGGRVLTDRKLLDGARVELGGEFIGTNHPTWTALAKKFSVELEEVAEFEGEEAFILEGALLKGEELAALHGEIDAMVEQLLEIARGVDPARPWAAKDAAALDGQSMLEWINNAKVSDRARAIMIAYEESDNGVPAGRMSLLAYAAVVAGGGFADYFEMSETHRAAGGNDALATALARRLGDRVKLRSPVAKVERTKDAAVLTLGDGTPVSADAVVLAIPPTQWDKIEFSPALPADLKPQFGMNTKLILKCDATFWEASGLSPDLYSDGLVQIGWVSGQSDADGAAYTLFSGADRAAELRQLPAADRTTKACASLSAAFPGLRDHVKKDVFIDWPGMPRVKGSYSFPAPGEVTRLGPILVEGLGADGLAPLKFAGEYTSYAFIGYMEGALGSGVRVAGELSGRRA